MVLVVAQVVSCSRILSSEKSTRVAFGEDVPATQMPYFVTVVTYDYFFGPATCGGTIIAEGVILTAAHCVVDSFREPFFDISILLPNGTDENGTSTYMDVDVSQISIPDVYNPAEQPYQDEYYGDIALLRVNPNVTKHRVRLPMSKKDLEEAPVLIGSGTGLDEEKKLSKKLEFVSVQKVDKVPNGSTLALEKDHFIAKDPIKNQDTCVGDSGGPLVIPNKRWNVSDPAVVDIRSELPSYDIQVGIVSYGEGIYDCGDNNTFGIYTDVMYWRDWIDEQLNNEKGWLEAL